MSIRTIFKSIGNAFKAGWNNGNLAKGISAAGSVAMGVGVVGSMFTSSNNNCNCNSSIFNSHRNSCNNWAANSFMNLGASSMMDPYSMGSFGNFNGSFGNLGGSFGGMSSLFGSNPYLNLGNTSNNPYMSLNLLRSFSNNTLAEIKAKQQNNAKLRKSNDEMRAEIAFYNGGGKKDFEDAAAVDESVDTKLGKKFAKDTEKLSSNDVDSVNLITPSAEGATSEEKLENYKKQVLDIAKSYIKYLDTNNDGYINEDEFVDSILQKELPTDATDEDRKTLENNARNWFKKIDLNKSGDDNGTGIDYKEMASLITLFDTGGKSTNPSNGIITAEEYKKAQDSFRAENIEFSSNLFKTYNAYYKNSD